MLWQRLLTALVLIPAVVGGILYLDSTMLAVVLAGIILLGAHEMAQLANLHHPLARGAFILAVAVLLWLAWHYLGREQVVSLQSVMAIWWVLMTIVLVFRRSALPRIESSRPTILILGALVLVSAWISIVTLHAVGPRGPALVLFLFILIWMADSGAYFAGRAFGRRKLSPFVSPGKTWAGVAGAIAAAALSAVVLNVSGAVESPALLALIVLSVLVTAVSIGGDLWESRLKREAGVKDSGHLLPGHGGILDRIDSLLAAAPLFALGAGWLGLPA